MRELVRARARLALHVVRDGRADAGAPALLLLHELGGSSARWTDDEADVLAWPGARAIYALDFVGHGASADCRGSAYWAEGFAADADAALAAIGASGSAPVCVAGRGVGAYVAMLLAGARPAVVRGAALLPGAGLAGAGPEPDLGGALAPLPPRAAPRGAPRPAVRPDPRVALADAEPRPPAYARAYAERARRLVAAPCAPAPPWWSECAKAPAWLAAASPADALRRLAD